MIEQQETCGPIYLRARDAALQDIVNEESRRAFSAGFVVGQAEKVYIGACRAAMFRPPNDDRSWYEPVVRRIAEVYRLNFQSWGEELWIVHPEYDGLLAALTGGYDPRHPDNNTPASHMARAYLCGVKDADPYFHHRKGARQEIR